MTSSLAVFDARNIVVGGGVTFVEEIAPRVRDALAAEGIDLRIFLGPPTGIRQRVARRLQLSRARYVVHAGNRGTLVAPGARRVLVVQDRSLIDGPAPPAFSRKALRRLLTAQAIRVADTIVVPSHTMAGLVRARAEVSRRKTPVDVVPHGGPDWDAPAARPFGEELRLFYPTFVHSGSSKNIELLPRLLRLGLEKVGPLRLTLTLAAGDIWKGVTLEEMFADVASHVRFTGAIARRELASVYAVHDVLVFPSRVESFGLPLLEAMTSNMPIVVSDLDWARELCGDGALYADAEAEDEWVARLRELRARGRRENPAGLRRAAGFDWDASALELARVMRGGDPEARR